MQLENGTYAAKPVGLDQGWASVYESQESGALMVALKFAIADGPTITARTCLVSGNNAKNPNMVMENNILRLREWSGWDGADPYWFMEADLTALDVELVIENKEYKGKINPEVKWINKPGSGGGYQLPDAADRKAVLAKYGAKFRALAGGTSVPAAKPAAAPPTRSAPPARPAPVAPKATQASAWAKFGAKFTGLSDDERDAKWFEFVDATGMDQADMTPEGWAQVEAAIEAPEGLPF